MSEDVENSQDPEKGGQALTTYIRQEIIDQQRKSVRMAAIASWVFSGLSAVCLTSLVGPQTEELLLWMTLLFSILAVVGVMVATYAVRDHATRQEDYAFISELPDSYFTNGSDQLKLLRALVGITDTDKTRTAIMVELCLLGPADTQQD